MYVEIFKIAHFSLGLTMLFVLLAGSVGMADEREDLIKLQGLKDELNRQTLFVEDWFQNKPHYVAEFAKQANPKAFFFRPSSIPSAITLVVRGTHHPFDP